MNEKDEVNVPSYVVVSVRVLYDCLSRLFLSQRSYVRLCAVKTFSSLSVLIITVANTSLLAEVYAVLTSGSCLGCVPRGQAEMRSVLSGQ